MECSKIIELLPLYLEDMLDSGEKVLAEEHLRTCESCREELAFLKKIQTQTMNLPEIEPSEQFKEGLFKRLKEEKRKKTAFYMSGGFKKAVSIAMSAAVITICITALDTELYKNNEEILNGKEQIALSDGKTDNVLPDEPEKNEITKERNEKIVTQPQLADTSGEVKREVQKDVQKAIPQENANQEENMSLAEVSLPSVVNGAEEKDVAAYDSEQGADTKAETTNAHIKATSEEMATQKARISSGGGSSKADSKNEQSLIKRTLKISLPDGQSDYLEILKGFEVEDGIYKIPVFEFDRVVNELVATPDCIIAFENTDFSEEYKKMVDSGENQERLLEIEDITSYGYVIIE